VRELRVRARSRKVDTGFRKERATSNPGLNPGLEQVPRLVFRGACSSVIKIAALAAIGFATGCASLAGAPAKPETTASLPETPVFLQTDVLGLEAGALDTLLGPAVLTRREGSGEFRRYAFARCELIVILYPDDSGKAAVRRLDAAAKNSGEDKPGLDFCLAGGLARQAAG